MTVRSAAFSTAANGTSVQITKARYDKLLDAEIVHFARALKPHPLTLQEILTHRDPEALREFLLEELPIRFARRMHMIETMSGWERYPQMRSVRSLYGDAFRRLRGLSVSQESAFRSTLLHIKRASSEVVLQTVKGVHSMKMRSDATAQRCDEFLDEFLTARIGTDILSSQYLAITSPQGPTSVIQPDCDPVEVVRSSAGDAVKMCRHHYGSAPPVDVVDIGQVNFPFIPHYLDYILFELFKNSLRAVTEQHRRTGQRGEPVRVLVTGDETTVVIRVSDVGGGIPLNAMQNVWSYMYTTAKPVIDDGAETSDYEVEHQVVPMAGFGCGLPLSRNYASYVGGRLELCTVPHYGTDAYLYLNRLGDSREIVGADNAPLPSRGFL